MRVWAAVAMVSSAGLMALALTAAIEYGGTWWWLPALAAPSYLSSQVLAGVAWRESRREI